MLMYGYDEHEAVFFFPSRHIYLENNISQEPFEFFL